MSTKLDQFDGQSWQQISEHAQQKIIDNGEKRVRLLKLAPGFQEQDWCHRGHTGYIIDGQLTLEFENDQVTYQPGDVLLVSVGQPHKASTNSQPAILFLVDDI